MIVFQFEYTGSAINPARTLGPAIVANKWDDHWVCRLYFL